MDNIEELRLTEDELQALEIDFNKNPEEHNFDRKVAEAQLHKVLPHIEHAKKEVAREIFGELVMCFSVSPDVDNFEIALDVIFQKIKSLISKYLEEKGRS